MIDKEEPVMTRTWVLRPLSEADGELLRTATLTNLNWAGEQRFTYQDIDGAPEIRHYYCLRPDRGDFGFVAEQDGLTLGVVWVLFLESSDPGYGFIADRIPELSIAVWSGYRGQGVGRSLITGALDEARGRGIQQISLSVEPGNPSLFLCRGVGFERAEGTPEGTYAVNLAEGGATSGPDQRGRRGYLGATTATPGR